MMGFKLKKQLYYRMQSSAAMCALLLAVFFSGVADAATITVNASIGFDKDAYSDAGNPDTDFSSSEYLFIKNVSSSTAKVTYVQFKVPTGFSPSDDTKVELVLSARKIAGDTTVEIRDTTNATWNETLVNDSTSPSVSHTGGVLKSFDVTTLAQVSDSNQGVLYTLDITELITSAGDYSFALTITANGNRVDFFSRDAQLAGNQPKINITNAGTKGFSVSPSYFIVNGDENGSKASRRQIITITNEGSYDFTYKGNDNYGDPSEKLYEEYNKSTSTCSNNTVLTTGASCSFTLTQQLTAVTRPTHDVYRIKYKYPDLDNVVRKLPIFIKDISAELLDEQGERRIAPVLKNFRITDTGTDTTITALPIPGTDYDAKFDVDGYHDAYRAVIAFFDCADTAVESCAAGFGSNIGWVEATSGTVSTGETSYFTEDSSATEFIGTITMPVYSNNLVARVYYRSDVDEDMKHSFISIIAAGGQDLSLADGLGRKIIIEAAQ
ncbi:CBM96 family carbohydrate-binding protein [Thalassotalea sp. ND16A]|uniref:CBM96 family carbohydrate-binding protein n=1 Tax=Thalassotalea sp. ND16A TaxID=1535422 RepID=UPI00051A0CBC|nr:DNRLRE domain-containing protein [Thalassotalea sp. ND16A]KGK00093.1 hypothetical protein ND16A_0284 [Thalassotalea sp. ND16A]